MRILVTGARGFAGRYVVRELADHGHTPLAFDAAPPAGAGSGLGWTGDLRDAGTLQRVVAEAHPDACIHLGGISFVPLSWQKPAECFAVNVEGTLHLLEALRAAAPRARVLVVTSAEVYGRPAAARPLTEDAPLQPMNPYAVSKAAADHLALLYARHHGQPVFVARPKNHIGPGQSPHFVAAAFAEQIARVALGRMAPVMRVGNLDSQRDFTDVRDVARAYRLLIEHARLGEAYNIAAARRVSIRELLDILCRVAGVQPRLETDPARLRPQDQAPLLSVEKIQRDVGWQAEIPLEQSLRDLYRHFYDALRAAG